MSDSKEIVVHTDRAEMVMVASPAEMAKRQAEMTAFVQTAMTPSRDGTGDYGVIPGAGNRKTLFKAGAEKLCALFNLAAEYIDDGSTEDWTNGFFNYKKKCRLTLRDSGVFVGEGIGSCNSREKKYAGRWVPEAEVPGYLPKATLKSRKEIVWIFDNKMPKTISLKERESLPMKSGNSNGKPWQMFGVEDVTYFVPNEDIYSLVNTIEKMAAKRAFVSAVAAATRVSGLFDGKFDEGDLGEVEDTRSWEQRQADEAKAATGAPATAPTASTKRQSSELVALLADCKILLEKGADTAEVTMLREEKAAVIQALTDGEFQVFKDESDKAWDAIAKRTSL